MTLRRRHTRFYLPRGTDIFAVQNTLYKLHADLLGLKGGVMKDLLELPQSMEGREGLTDDNPIVLPQLTEKEFEHYLDFVYQGHMLPPHPLQKLVDVLKVSTQWEVDDGRTWAIHHLEHTENVPASLRLRLALRYEVPQWVEPAFRDLVFNVPVSHLKRDDLASIGYPVYALITKVKEAIDRERRVLAHLPPELNTHDPTCANNARCAMIWRETWWMKIGRRLLDPDPKVELTFAAGPDAVRNVEWTGMTAGCREKMVMAVTGGQGFAGPEQIFAAGLKSLPQYDGQSFE
ncbi:hypothetical protein C8T65DRAFT_743210 [Cerioporus squamosus]|nr:hypothetical protein C8T65DRAFT_743210 [Cerioporus squamosus]